MAAMRLSRSHTILVLAWLGVACASGRTTPWGVACSPVPDDYVPRDVDDAIATLACQLPPRDLQELTAASEEDLALYHLGLGMGVRNGWGLWGDSRLAHHFREIGIQHPDDMSAIILDSLWRRLHDQPPDVDGQVEYYQEYWAAYREITPPACPDDGRIEEMVRVTESSHPDPWLVRSYVRCTGDLWFEATNRDSTWTRSAGPVGSG